MVQDKAHGGLVIQILDFMENALFHREK